MQALLTNRMKRKLALVFALIVLALLGVSVRLAYINKTSGDKYTKKVLAQQDTNSTTLPYRRGDILDRNGTILATSEKVYNLILDPKETENRIRCPEYASVIMEMKEKLLEFYQDTCDVVPFQKDARMEKEFTRWL